MQYMRNLFILLPIMGYYLLESLLIALFVSLVWNHFLQQLFKTNVSYLQWVAIIWIIKIIFFDLFKTFLRTINNNDNNNDNE